MFRTKILMVLTGLMLAPLVNAELDWDTALNGKHRAEGNAARNEARHPRETLEFFGLEPGMTVLEVSPGGGWYTEVLAPLLRDNGKLIAAHYSPNGGAYARRLLGVSWQNLVPITTPIVALSSASFSHRPRWRRSHPNRLIWHWLFAMCTLGCG